MNLICCLCLFLQLTLIAVGADYHIRPGPDTYGSGDGSDWDNAYNTVNLEFERGSTYYFSGGTFPLEDDETIVFDTPEDGTSLLKLVKAVDDDHGSDNGWNSDWSSEQTIFESSHVGNTFGVSSMRMRRSHVLIDGKWGTLNEDHGFVFKKTQEACESATEETQFEVLLIQAWDYETDLKDLTLRNCHFELCGERPYYFGAEDDIIYTVQQQDLEDVTFQNCIFRSSSRTAILLPRVTNLLMEGCVLQNIGGAEESNTFRFSNGGEGIVIRNSVWENFKSYSITFGNDITDVDIYNNVFMRSERNQEYTQSSSMLGSNSQIDTKNVNIYSNTFLWLQGLDSGIRFSGSNDNLNVFNNIWAYNMVNQIHFDGDYNTANNVFCNNIRLNEPNYVYLDDNYKDQDNAYSCGNDFNQRLFLKYSQGMSFDEADLSLIEPLSQLGKDLGSQYDTDFNGNTRGGNGGWDQGAYEYVANDCGEVCEIGDQCHLPGLCESLSCTGVSNAQKYELCIGTSTQFASCVNGNCEQGICPEEVSVPYSTNDQDTCNSALDDESCQFSCLYSNEVGEVTCQDSKWQEPSIECNSVCSIKPRLKYATLRDDRCSVIGTSSTCVYSCESNVNDQIILKCQNDEWLDPSPEDFECGGWVCGKDPDFENYHLNGVCLGSMEGDLCEKMECEYRGTVSKYPECQEDGSWTSPEGCYELLDCKIEHCSECGSDGEFCNKCDEGFKISEVGNECVKSCEVHGCHLCSDWRSCKFCKNTLKPNADGSACVTCEVHNCNSCDEDGKCLACDSGYKIHTVSSSENQCQITTKSSDDVSHSFLNNWNYYLILLSFSFLLFQF
ncbi:hypothetical protein M0813_06647 [Anaeramoeba flamelloides]|uniref:Uncharacterized protein n=1 Tax=Anaeramoeba flamelloides TaxID=1746091 RepID=A0ABQ8XEA7_9EUKA|nr:hypothetical protein M0813_06647 [Anaeramoeba flamelloides]